MLAAESCGFKTELPKRAMQTIKRRFKRQDDGTIEVRLQLGQRVILNNKARRSMAACACNPVENTPQKSHTDMADLCTQYRYSSVPCAAAACALADRNIDFML
jgi:hypothetical protein